MHCPVHAAVNLAYEPQGCCNNNGSGVLEAPPEEMFKAGLSRAVYEQWIQKLDDVRRMRATGCHELCCCITM
jgi:hypothetical protein